MDIEKMIEQLQNAAGGPEGINMCQDAAIALSTLQAENKKLRAELNDLKNKWDKYQPREHWETLNELCENLRDELKQVKRERDAAIKDIWMPKWISCKNGENCTYISAITSVPDCAGCNNWKWRGQKEDA